MSLPSQSTRASRSAGVSYRQSRSSMIKKIAPPALVVGVLAVIVWFATRPAPETDPALLARSAEPEAANAAQNDAPVVIDQSAPPRPLPGAPRRDPEVIAAGPVLDTDAQRKTEDPIVETPTVEDRASDDRAAEDRAAEDAADESPAADDPDRTGSLLRSTVRRAERDRSTPTRSGGGIAPIERARDLIAQGRRVEARRYLSVALGEGGLSASERAAVRGLLTDINSVLVFGPVAAPNDPITEEYTVRPGDSLSRIAARRELATHWKLIQRVNRISDPSRIRLGQTLKLVRGPFHAVVHKNTHRMDLYHGPPADPDRWVYIRSVRVGLGLDDGTPVGRFRVSNQLENPGWVNPRDGSERYAPGDPDNPIGEYWIGLDGVGAFSSLSGYGIHGTNEPDTIGRDESMGCVRCADGDIEVVYELLAPGVSLVEIRP